MQRGTKTTRWTAAIALMATVVLGCLSNHTSSRQPEIGVVTRQRPTSKAVAHATESRTQKRSQISRTVPKLRRSPEVIREKIARKEAKLARGDREESKGGPASGPREVMRQRRMARLAAAGNGTTISIKAVTYDEGSITFFKRGRVIATGGLVRIR